jgi:hypothetical protein
MERDQLRRLAVAVCLLLPILACDLGRAPGIADVEVDGREIVIEPYLVRGFMPGMSPPDGGPLAVYIDLAASDSLPLPQGLSADHAWVVKGLATWETDMMKDETSPSPWNAVFRGFGGPKWGPSIRVDVTVRIALPDGGSTRVRIPRCMINRSE